MNNKKIFDIEDYRKLLRKNELELARLGKLVDSTQGILAQVKKVILDAGDIMERIRRNNGRRDK